jgi:hypothetical protein
MMANNPNCIDRSMIKTYLFSFSGRNLVTTGNGNDKRLLTSSITYRLLLGKSFSTLQ